MFLHLCCRNGFFFLGVCVCVTAKKRCISVATIYSTRPFFCLYVTSFFLIVFAHCICYFIMLILCSDDIYHYCRQREREKKKSF